MLQDVADGQGDKGNASAPRTAAQGGVIDVSRLTVIDVPDEVLHSKPRAISGKDLLQLASLPVQAAVAWFCSDAVCLRLFGGLTRLLYRLQSDRYGDFERIYREFLSDEPQADAQAGRIVEAATLHHLERLQLLRCYRPGGWQPRIVIEGKEHLDRALARGKGAILWVTYATFSDMISKIALHELGHHVWHLSRHIHGHFSSTRFGMRYLNPIRIAIECRSLADRVVIDPDDPKVALARLQELLADNHVVSITVVAAARRLTLVPFGPGCIPLAAGAPSLAVKSGAALLPLFIERRPDGSFLVTIEPALEPSVDAGREQQVAELIAREGALLRRYFERLPTQFHYSELHSVRRRWEAATKRQAKAG